MTVYTKLFTPSIGQILGLSSGVVVGGISADYFGWRLPFFLIAVWFAVIGVYLQVVERKLPSHARQLHIGEGHIIHRLVSEFRRVLEISWARKILLTVSLEGAIVFGVLAFVPTHLHTIYGLSLSMSGSLVVLFGLGGLLFAMQSKKMVRHLGEVGLIRRGSVLMSVSLGLLAITPWWWLTIPACFGFGLGFYMMHNTLQINATQMAPQRRGAAVAAFASVFFLGQSIGVASGGLILHAAGTPTLILTGASLILLVGFRFAREVLIK